MARRRSDQVAVARSGQAIEPAELVAAPLELDPDLRLESYYSERSVFYNPGGTAPLGVLVASIKDHDGPNDQASRLSRPGVYRLCFQLSREAFAARFGEVPARPPRGGVVELDFDPSALNELGPHPVYAWMRWVQILSPTARELATLQPALEESLSLAKAKSQRRRAA